MRIVQPNGTKGSLRWLQDLINRKPELLQKALQSRMALRDGAAITWLSPLKSDRFAEYRDESFLERLGVTLDHRSLASFWPPNGPQWDALGITSRGDLLLVEAKAHVKELVSDCGASPKSSTLIQASLAEAGAFFMATTTKKWSQTYYQYANRLAHLYLLRQLNHLPAWLIFLYFVNAEDVAGPKTPEEWRSSIEEVHNHLGVGREQIGPYVIDVFIDVEMLSKPARVHYR